MSPHNGEYRPKWENRRRVIFLSLLFCAVCIIYVMVTGQEGEVAESIVQLAFLSGTFIVGSYVFGATWDSANIMRNGK
jgi:hypothetical protein